MARRRYRRRRRRSGRWAPNIVKISNNIDATAGEWYYAEELALNPIQQSSGVSQTFTAKNFEINFTLENGNSFQDQSNQQIESVTAYIMYVPQGMNITSSYYAEHPEYILAYKYLGSPHGLLWYYFGEGPTSTEIQQYQPYRIRSRLSRKLQTGDRIILYLQGSNQATTTRSILLNGIIRWWSKAN